MINNMEMELFQITRNFYGVHNALFCKEIVQKGDMRKTIVYDCGTYSDKSITSIMKKVLQAGEEKEKIDMLFISHYDIDHIRCLKALLKGADVKMVVLPLLSYQDKFYTLSNSRHSRAKVNHDLWNFAIDPQWVMAKWGVNIPVVKYVEGPRTDSFSGLDDAIRDYLFKCKEEEWMYIPFNPCPYNAAEEDKFFEELRKRTKIDTLNKHNVIEKWKESLDIQAVINPSLTL